ncbi:hypothetical protein ACFX2G_046414 [Malus domestica]
MLPPSTLIPRASTSHPRLQITKKDTPIFNPSLIISQIVLYSKNKKLNRIGFVGLELESVSHPSAVAIALNSGGRNGDEMKERQCWQPEEDALMRWVKRVEPCLPVDGEAPLP